MDEGPMLRAGFASQSSPDGAVARVLVLAGLTSLSASALTTSRRGITMRIVRILEVALPVMLVATANAQTKPTIVLVHGAFAAAAGWSGIIERLQKRGYNVVAVENPLSGL